VKKEIQSRGERVAEDEQTERKDLIQRSERILWFGETLIGQEADHFGDVKKNVTLQRNFSRLPVATFGTQNLRKNSSDR